MASSCHQDAGATQPSEPPSLLSEVSSARPIRLLWQGMSVLLAITAQPPPLLRLSSPAQGACTSHREEGSTGQTVAPVNQVRDRDSEIAFSYPDHISP